MELGAAEANRRFYEEAVEYYDRVEECVVDSRLQARLRDALKNALPKLPPHPRVLDACGGSGNASLMLLDLGVQPTTVDISPEMLRLYEQKAETNGHTPDCIVSEIGLFLEQDAREWDLIVFSSALHHFDDPQTVMDLACDRLTPGGLILTMFDPTALGRFGVRIRRLEYIAHVFLKTPRRVPTLVAKRLRRRDVAGPNVGAIAERHSASGVDDLAIRERLESRGLRVLAHERYYEGRFAPTRALYRVLRRPSSFHLLLQARG